MILVSVAAVTIAAVRVHREQRFAQVSRIAEVAQRAVMPVLPEHAGHVAIAARYQSAAQGALVGGDLYDCYHADEHVRILVGDVRGKGITGVEQAARVTRAFRQSAPLRATLAEVAEEMDSYLAGFFDEEEFATALLVDVSDPGVLRLVSAGHPGPQLVRSSEARGPGPPDRAGVRPRSAASRLVRRDGGAVVTRGPAAALHRRAQRGPGHPGRLLPGRVSRRRGSPRLGRTCGGGGRRRGPQVRPARPSRGRPCGRGHRAPPGRRTVRQRWAAAEPASRVVQEIG